MLTRVSFALLVSALVATPSVTHLPPANLRASRLVGDHMVLQRDVPIVLWGWVDPQHDVRVSLDDRAFRASVTKDGAWKVTLPPMRAGGPHTITITSGAERIRATDVLIGDVWICSGQSNMEWTVGDARDGEREIASANDSRIRHFKVPQSWSETPEPDLVGGSWEVADPAHVGEFTAVGYFFARELRKHVDVPIGLINTSWGGSRVEPWMSRAALRMDSVAIDEIMQHEREHQRRLMDSLRARLGTVPTVDEGLVDSVARWADPALDESSWASIAVPGRWEEQGYAGLDGVVWYRTSFSLSADDVERPVRLGFGMIDDSDITWVNGVLVGRTDGWNEVREYQVPPSALRPGRNVVAIRVQDFQGGGGIHGSNAQVFVDIGGTRRSLDSTWKLRVGAGSVGTDGQRINRIPTVLHNRMIHPLLPYRIRGALWYQGESNANTVEEAEAYAPLFTTLIRSWRREWRQGDFPFLWVQLASFMAADDEPPVTSGWASLRESQSAARSLPNAAQVIAIDVGDAEDIHPRNKQDVGARLALAARRVAYGQRVVHSGPTYRTHQTRGSRVLIEFDHVAGGLVVKGNAGVPGGFAVAGEDRRFVWADARIENGRVVVWSDRVARPIAVRYAWAANPDRANLYNDVGLPAAPFRTDRW